MTRQLQFTFIDKNWKEQLKFIVSDDYFIHCDLHGDWCANACYDDTEISRMFAEQGHLDCPECLREIVGFD